MLPHVLAAFLLMASAEEARVPSFTCAVQKKVPKRRGVEIRVRCASTNTGGMVPEWRLFGESDDSLTDFNEGHDFEFIAPDVWRLLEMRLTRDDGHSLRLRTWVRESGRMLEWKRYGSEGD